MKILVIGKGYIGARCMEEWPDAEVTEEIIVTKDDALRVIKEYQPDAVLNAAGIRGVPNVDWCDSHQLETMRGNTILPLILADACAELGVYLLHIGSGCVFYGESPDPGGWLEDDHANPSVTYSRTKYAADLVLSTLPNVGIARIRMPIDERPSPGNLIDKLASFEKVIDVENSATVIPDMIKVFRALLEKKAEGIFHVTNPGTIKHREIIAMYEEIVDPNHTNEWIENEELVTQGLATKGRSNNQLQSERLEELGIGMRPIKEAVRACLENYPKK